tara:strand:+ start:978 stop:1328 length:351 start_codon:yes stop_codon:yes gene_type:complete
MVGNKNSGRKKDPVSDYIRMGKKTLYIRQTQSSDTGKWIDDPVFTWFKRHHGAKWQSQVREFMRLDVAHYKREHFWRCKCPNNGLLGNYVPNRVGKCHICNTWKNKITELQHGGRR